MIKESNFNLLYDNCRNKALCQMSLNEDEKHFLEIIEDFKLGDPSLKGIVFYGIDFYVF